MTPLTTLLTVAPDAATGKSLFDYIASGREVGLVILGLSLVAMGFIIAGLIRIRLRTLAPQPIVDELTAHLRAGRVREAARFCSDAANDTFLTRIFKRALVRCARSPFGFLEIRTAIEESGRAETDRLHRSIEPIGVIAAVAPMLGLLGTVIGMVGAFDTISDTEGVARPSELAGSISIALITTVMGLIVAILCTPLFALLRSRADHLAGEIAQISEELAGYLEIAAQQQGAAPARGNGGPRPNAAPSPQPVPNPTPSA
ncbi:MAG: MotA/TolQ/ExbB proton channel family protein [Planctomycetota bacterium]